MKRALVCIVGFAVAAMAAAPASAWGPGMHAREANVLADDLAAIDAGWAEVFAQPGTRDALVLGSVTPDFRQVVDALPFGHLRTLGYHLIDVAADGTPQQRAFALGYLAHVVSDNVADTFVAPGLWVMNALGPFDLVVDEPETLVAETELICETFGDLIIGDWHAVVDALVTYRNGGDAARAELDALMGWYCEQAVIHTGTATDCALARTQLEGVLTRVDDLIGSFTRSGAHALIDVLLDQAPIDLLPIFTGGALSSLLGDTFAFGPHSESELARFEHTALVDETFWALYDEHWASLASTLTRVQLERRADGWPRRHNNALRGGNWISAFRFLDPAWWGDGGGLVVESLRWEIGGRAAVELNHAELPAIGVAHVAVFATRPFVGSVEASVLGDRPGLDLFVPDDLDGRAVFGQDEFLLDLDPARSVDEGLTVLAIPFEVPAGADLDGLVVDVALAGAQPFFSSNAEALVTQPSALPMWQPSLRRLLSTYADWPGSLPADREAAAADLVVAVRVAPAGEGIADATLGVGDALVGHSAQNGVFAFAAIEPGTYRVRAAADGYRDAELADMALVPGRNDVDVFLTPWLHPSAAPYTGDTRCVDVTWSAARWGSTLPPVHSRMVPSDGAAPGSETAHGRVSPIRSCAAEEVADGTVVRVEVQARPVRGEPTEWESTGEVMFDRSPPRIEQAGVEVTDPLDCVDGDPLLPPAQVRVQVSDPHSGIASVDVFVLDAAGNPLLTAPLRLDDGGLYVGEWDAPVAGVAAVEVAVVNGAGLAATQAIEPPLVGEACTEPSPEPHDVGRAETDPSDAGADAPLDARPEVDTPPQGDDVDDTPAPSLRGGGGCAAGAGSAAGAPALLAPGFFLRRRRRRGTRR